MRIRRLNTETTLQIASIATSSYVFCLTFSLLPFTVGTFPQDPSVLSIYDIYTLSTPHFCHRAKTNKQKKQERGGRAMRTLSKPAFPVQTTTTPMPLNLLLKRPKEQE